MTLDSERYDKGRLPLVDEWLEQLGPDELTLLRAHLNDVDLSAEVMRLLQTGPISPMQVSNGGAGSAAKMPPAVRQALERDMPD
jgi:hypothetical protein